MVSDIGMIAAAISIATGVLACAYQNHAALPAAYGALGEGNIKGLSFTQVLLLTAMGETLAVFGLLGGLIIFFML